jgi:hypothetical protein
MPAGAKIPHQIKKSIDSGNENAVLASIVWVMIVQLIISFVSFFSIIDGLSNNNFTKSIISTVILFTILVFFYKNYKLLNKKK